MQRIEDIEEVLAWRPLAGWVFIGKEPGKFRIFAEGWPEILHRQFIVVRNGNLLNFSLLHELLLPTQDILQEVFVDDVIVG